MRLWTHAASSVSESRYAPQVSAARLLLKAGPNATPCVVCADVGCVHKTQPALKAQHLEVLLDIPAFFWRHERNADVAFIQHCQPRWTPGSKSVSSMLVKSGCILEQMIDPKVIMKTRGMLVVMAPRLHGGRGEDPGHSFCCICILLPWIGDA